ncbi:unnamed protein product, partial [Didymodactylos carnosus]
MTSATAPTSPRSITTPTTLLTDGLSTTTITNSPSSSFLLRPDQSGEQSLYLRFSPDSDRSFPSTTSTLTRSKSAHSLRQQQQQQQQATLLTNPNSSGVLAVCNEAHALATTIDDAKTVLAQIFWIGICLLESDYEYEFSLAVQLLETIVVKVTIDTPDYIERIMNIHRSMKWQTFPGFQALLLKGCTSTITYESTVALVGRLTNIMSCPFVSTNAGS